MSRFLRSWFLKDSEHFDRKVSESEKPEHDDVLAVFADGEPWREDSNISAFEFKPITEFKFGQVVVTEDDSEVKVMDGKTIATMDNEYSGQGEPFNMYANAGNGFVPTSVQGWYTQQTFIGYQNCLIMAQQWLINKVCRMPGEDAVRNGYDVNVISSKDVPDAALNEIKEIDKLFKLKKHMADQVYWRNVYGIRVMLFVVESKDPFYYEKPFNLDGVTPGSYKGMKGIDPYWMSPMLSPRSGMDPADLGFYEPEWWIISGKKYHKSHLVISVGADVGDMLKPNYLFGGVSLVQRIYERVYAAERTANEAPLLAMSKRTTALHVDLTKALASFGKFMNRIKQWVMFRDNHQIKVLGKDESVEQFDTNLSDFDSIIMNQYQLVCSIAECPATKILGTSPKGFNATGEFEMKNYHEKLESEQSDCCVHVADRHHKLAIKSYVAPKFGIEPFEVEVSWNPVNSLTSAELAAINKTNAETGQILINIGSISPDEERNRLREDKLSGYNNLSMEEADTDFGESPENLSENTIATAKETTANAKEQQVSELGASAKMGGIDDSDDWKQAIRQLLEVFGDGRMEFDENLRYRPKSSEIYHSGFSPKIKKTYVHGLPVTIENHKGTVRSGVGNDGKEFSSMMPAHYGFVRGVVGADGDGIDVFVGEDSASNLVHVINQISPDTRKFDEHKCMMCFSDTKSALNCYKEAYSKDWKGFGNMVTMTVDEFKNWLRTGDLESPAVK